MTFMNVIAASLRARPSFRAYFKQLYNSTLQIRFTILILTYFSQRL